jgi:hypothetical protein
MAAPANSPARWASIPSPVAGAAARRTARWSSQTVPTLVYPDGSAQANPSIAQVKEKLAALAA